MAERCEDLPEECWELILKRLDHHSHFQSLSLVSKTFLYLTNRLRLKFTVTSQTILLHGTISKFLNRFDHLKSLNFSKFQGNLDLILNTSFTSALNLEYLDVSNQKNLPVLGEYMKNLKVFKCANLCRLSDTDLLSISVMMPFLEDLDISYPNNNKFDSEEFTVTDVGIEALWSSLRNLRKLNISGNHFITDRSVIGLSMNCLLLSEIVILDCSFITQKAFHFLLCNCHNLNVISVNRIKIIPPRVSSTYVRALCSVDLSDSVTISDEVLASFAKACWPLETLTLSRCMGFTFFGISRLLYAYQSLKHLALVKSCFLTDQCVSELAQYLVHLVSINLDSCFHLTTLSFFTLVTKCPSLEHIQMSKTSVGKVDCSMVVENKRIKSLMLSENLYLSDGLLKYIASTCPDMELLNISSTYRTTEKGIADVLKICHRIRNLQINYCVGISSLGTGLELPRLEVLSVARSGFGDKGLEIISQRCPGLLKLDMEGCYVATTKHVEEVLIKCERLREINLKDCCHVNVFSAAAWIVSLRRSYLKVIPPSPLPFTNCYKHLWSHGCLLE